MIVKDRKEFYLDIKRVAGTDTVSREHGRKIRNILELRLRLKNKIIIDF